MSARRKSNAIALIVGVVGVIITIGIFGVAAGSARSIYEAERHEAGLAAAHDLEEAFDSAEIRLQAIEGLFHASDFVNPAEFSEFANDLEFGTGVEGIGYIDTVTPGSLGRFIGAAQAEYEGFGVFGLDEELQPVPVSLDATHQILVYAAPLDAFGQTLGLDFASLPETWPTFEQAEASGSVLATPLFDRNGGTTLRDLLLVNPINRPAGGFGAVLMNLDLILETTMSVEDAVVTLDQVGPDTTAPDGDTWTTIAFAGGVGWQITVDPEEPFTMWTAGRFALLAFGLVLSVGAAVLTRLAVTSRIIRAEARATAAIAQQTDRLLTSVSHELRTPITGIIGFLDELSRRWHEIPDAQRIEMVELAEVSAEGMASVVSDLLVRERMLANAPLSVDVARIQVSDLVSSVVARLDGGKHTVTGVETPVVVIADRARLAQTIRGLVGAVSGPDRAPVEVTLQASPDRVRIAFASEHRIEGCCAPTIFVLGGSCRRHGPVASGFGPAVARYVARAMGGDVRHDPDTGGLVFELVPAARQAEATLVA